jgi:flagella basal body P-ring formation protein FlgA
MRITLSGFATLAALAVLAPVLCQGATLRGNTTLSSSQVRLSDLFDGLASDRAIGPGPEAGGRIVVEAAQLGAIARQFNVDWRPSSPGERIVLERPGRAFSRDAAVAALRTALATAGVSADAELDMPGFTPPMIPADVEGSPAVGELDYDPASGRFTAMLSVTAPGMDPAHARLSGRVQEMVDVPVATRRMMPGDVITPADLKMTRLRTSLVRTEVARVPSDAIGLALRHPVGPGSPFLLSDLGRPQAVQKGDAVQMELRGPGLALSAQGVAVDGGAVGERVRVLNATSRAVLDGEVVASGRVRIIGTTPVILPPGAALPVRLAAR